MRKERQSNIELLRIFAIIGVIILHYNNSNMGGGFAFVESGSINEYLLRLFESVSICAVDLFILISGFFLCRAEKRTLFKPLELIIQVSVFSGGLYLLDCILQIRSFVVKDFLYSLILNNYFVTLYIVLYLISPYINMLFKILDDKKRDHLMVLLLGIFSVWPTVLDLWNKVSGYSWNGLSPISMYGNQWGYTIVNFLLLYLVGAYLAYNKNKEIKIQYLFLLVITCVAVLFLWSIYDTGTAWEYCNPLIIFEAVLLFALFRRIKIKTSRWINSLAKAAFSVYLLHTAFIPYLEIESAVKNNPVRMVLHMFLTSALIYLGCWVFDLIYNFFVQQIKKLFGRVKMIACREKER